MSFSFEYLVAEYTCRCKHCGRLTRPKVKNVIYRNDLCDSTAYCTHCEKDIDGMKTETKIIVFTLATVVILGFLMLIFM